MLINRTATVLDFTSYWKQVSHKTYSDQRPHPELNAMQLSLRVGPTTYLSWPFSSTFLSGLRWKAPVSSGPDKKDGGDSSLGQEG